MHNIELTGGPSPTMHQVRGSYDPDFEGNTAGALSELLQAAA